MKRCWALTRSFVEASSEEDFLCKNVSFGLVLFCFVYSHWSFWYLIYFCSNREKKWTERNDETKRKQKAKIKWRRKSFDEQQRKEKKHADTRKIIETNFEQNLFSSFRPAKKKNNARGKILFFNEKSFGSSGEKKKMFVFLFRLFFRGKRKATLVLFFYKTKISWRKEFSSKRQVETWRREAKLEDLIDSFCF